MFDEAGEAASAHVVYEYCAPFVLFHVGYVYAFSCLVTYFNRLFFWVKCKIRLGSWLVHCTIYSVLYF